MIALKVDVCTAEGLRRGVPRLLDTLEACGVRATFFLSFGPDRSGLAALRLFRPGFLRKLLRTRALGLYGLRTALSGTLLPARPTASARPDLLRRIRDQGHEAALHGWDHRLWQDRMGRLSPSAVVAELDRAFRAYQEALGEPARAFGAPAWNADRAALEDLDRRGLEYTSNTRGGEPFYPVMEGIPLGTLEVPTTLACPEEVLATVLATGPGADPYHDSHHPIASDRLNVFPAHAEVEGSPRFSRPFRSWIERRKAAGERFVLLGDAARLARASGTPPRRPLTRAAIPGRPDLVLTGWPCYNPPLR